MTDVGTAPTPWHKLAEERGISLEWIAVMTGVSYSAVYRYKTGSRKAPVSWLEKVDLLIASRAAVTGSRDKVS
jgi:predicted transcriptional regulator